MSAYDRKDAAYVRAKQEGLRSRAALKLRELDRRFRVFRPGMRVLDLGCWPGGWLQVAAQAVGPSGRVVGVDLRDMEWSDPVNVRSVVGDVADASVVERAITELGGPADVVLSDLAPKLTGVRVADDARHEALVEAAVAIALEALGAEGALLVKLFSASEPSSTALLRRSFTRTAKTKPASTRKGSSEVYALARGPRRG